MGPAGKIVLNVDPFHSGSRKNIVMGIYYNCFLMKRFVRLARNKKQGNNNKQSHAMYLLSNYSIPVKPLRSTRFPCLFKGSRRPHRLLDGFCLFKLFVSQLDVKLELVIRGACRKLKRRTILFHEER